MKFISVQPKLDDYISSFTNPIFKNLRNIALSIAAYNICPFFGFFSKLFIGGALFSYNTNNIINDKFKKDFFSDEQKRKLYHNLLKLKEDTTLILCIRKIKELFRYFSWPFKNIIFPLGKKYILKEEKEKVGFE